MGNELQEVGKRIREAREDRQLSQLELANELGIAASHMSNVENGKTTIGLDIFMRLVRKLNVSADWLLQTNTPQVEAVYSTRLEKLFRECSPTEVKAIYEMAQLMKRSMEEVKRTEETR